MEQPEPVARVLLELCVACEKTRRISRVLRRNSGAVDGRLAVRSRKQLDRSRDLLAVTERPARQSI